MNSQTMSSNLDHPIILLSVCLDICTDTKKSKEKISLLKKKKVTCHLSNCFKLADYCECVMVNFYVTFQSYIVSISSHNEVQCNVYSRDMVVTKMIV